MQVILTCLLIAVYSVSQDRAILAGAANDRQATASIPVPAAKVIEIVSRYFQGLPDYKPGDLITRQQVEPLLPQMKKQGISTEELQQIVADLIDGNSFLARELHAPAGRKFMRRIAHYPEAYDRLDRLLQLPDGRRIVRRLVRGPGGEKMLEYLTKAPGGRVLGNMLSKDSEKKEFNRPTGKIYTEEMLINRLEQLLARRTKAGKDEPLSAKSGEVSPRESGNWQVGKGLREIVGRGVF